MSTVVPSVRDCYQKTPGHGSSHHTLDSFPRFVNLILSSFFSTSYRPVLVVVQNSVVLTITPGVPPPPYTLSITLAWLATIIALNMTLTGTIVLLLWPARRVAGSVITIVAESAAGYTAITVIYVAMTAANNPYGTLLLQLFGIGAVCA
jgi:hypothetical protein